MYTYTLFLHAVRLWFAMRLTAPLLWIQRGDIHAMSRSCRYREAQTGSAWLYRLDSDYSAYTECKITCTVDHRSTVVFPSPNRLGYQTSYRYPTSRDLSVSRLPNLPAGLQFISGAYSAVFETPATVRKVTFTTIPVKPGSDCT